MRKRELGAYSPTVGGQVDSQAHVAVRKAHEAAAVVPSTWQNRPSHPKHHQEFYNELTQYGSENNHSTTTAVPTVAQHHRHTTHRCSAEKFALQTDPLALQPYKPSTVATTMAHF